MNTYSVTYKTNGYTHTEIVTAPSANDAETIVEYATGGTVISVRKA